MDYFNSKNKKDLNIFKFEFTDSVYAFDEDLVETLENYCSLIELSSEDIKSMIYVLHSKCMELRNDEIINENLIEKFQLSDYGSGPQFENQNYFHILNGNYTVTKISNNCIYLYQTEMDDIIKINKKDLDSIQYEPEIINISSKILIDGGIESYICVNEKERLKIQNLLINDLHGLNKVLDLIGKAEDKIQIITSII
jgi:hypothetical protein